MTAFTKQLLSELTKNYYVVILDHLFKGYDTGANYYHANFRNLDFMRDAYLFIHTSETEGMPSIVKTCFEHHLPVLIPKWNGLANEILTPYSAGMIYNKYTSDAVMQAIKSIGTRYTRYRQDAFRQYGWLINNSKKVTTTFARLLMSSSLPSSSLVLDRCVDGPLDGDFLPKKNKRLIDSFQLIDSSSIVIFVTCDGYASRANEYNRPRYSLPVVLIYYGLPVIYLKYTEINGYLAKHKYLKNVAIFDMFGGYRRVLNDKIRVYKQLIEEFPRISIRLVYVIIFSEVDLLKKIVSKLDKKYFTPYYLHPKQSGYMGQIQAPSLEMYCPNTSVKRRLLESVPTQVDQLPNWLFSGRVVVFYKPTAITDKLVEDLSQKDPGLKFLYLTKIEDDEFSRSNRKVYRCHLANMSNLSRCFIFIHTSQEEGFPTIIKDCLEYGLPMILPSYNGLTELLFNKVQAGFIYKSISQIPAVVANLLKNPIQYSQYRHNCRLLYQQLIRKEKEVFYQCSQIVNPFLGNIRNETSHRFVFYLIGRNVKDYLRDCFRSMMRQVSQKWRIIYIDDQSTDGSLEELDLLINEFKLINRVMVISNSVRMYSSYNLKQLLDMYFEEKEVLIQLDPDDYLSSDPFILHKLDQVYNSNKTWMTYGQYFSLEPDFDLVLKGDQQNTDEQYYLLKTNQFADNRFAINFQVCRSFYAFLAKQVDTDIFRANGYYHHFNNDVALMKSLFQLCPIEKIFFNQEPFYVYRVAASINNPEAFRNRRLYPELEAKRERELITILKYPVYDELIDCNLNTRRFEKLVHNQPKHDNKKQANISVRVRPDTKKRIFQTRQTPVVKTVNNLKPKANSKPKPKPKVVRPGATSYIGLSVLYSTSSYKPPDSSVSRRSMLNQINQYSGDYIGNQMA